MLTAPALAFVEDLTRRFSGRIDELLARRRAVQAQLRCRRAPGLPGRDGSRANRRLESRADPGRSAGSPRRDHRSGRSQDDHQRAQLRRAGVHGRLRGRHLADVGQPRQRPEQPDRRRPADDHLRVAETGKRYALNAQTGDVDGPAARVCTWSSGTVEVDGTARSRGRSSTSASSSFTTRPRWPRRGTGPYFYLPKTQSHLEARLWNDVFVHAQAALGIPRGHDQGDRAHRNAAGRVRDGRDPVRAARITASASTAAAGTTSSARSRRCGTIRRSCCPIAGR